MMRRAILTTALLVAAIVSPTTAGPQKVNFPSGYKAHVLYATVDRPDNKTVRDLYASPEAARLASPGQPLPDGTVLTMEVYKAKVDEKGEPVRDGSGRMIRTDELLGIFVMEKRRGWGSEYPETLRNGEWEYARFTAGGQPQPGFDAKPCFQCHKPMSGQDFVFSLPKLTGRRP
ncbi:MAG: cytochrome P460 family protein [Candidatus Rokuibacteriota bacterium]